MSTHSSSNPNEITYHEHASNQRRYFTTVYFRHESIGSHRQATDLLNAGHCPVTKPRIQVTKVYVASWRSYLVLQEIENPVRCDRDQRLTSTSLSDASARLSRCARSTAMLQLHSFLVLRMARLRDCDVRQSVHPPESLPMY
jgi:hypothetical protein